MAQATRRATRGRARGQAPAGAETGLRPESAARGKDAGPAGDFLTSLTPLRLQTVLSYRNFRLCSASASSKTSLLQEVHTVHQEPDSDPERHYIIVESKTWIPRGRDLDSFQDPTTCFFDRPNQCKQQSWTFSRRRKCIKPIGNRIATSWSAATCLVRCCL